jgi:phosphatidylserine/phosphatidylglycerophosphate/cardiolipin synthase-like enzyme
LFDPLGAATLLISFASCGSLAIRPGLLADISRAENLAPQRLRALVAALQTCGLLQVDGDGLILNVTRDEALRHAAVLRGVAFANYRHRDANQVDITLSPPAHPSRLMEMLPKQGFSWARLYDTKDSLIELANQAQQRFTIVSPFLDDEGFEWIGSMFDAAAQNNVECKLIVRGLDEKELEVLQTHQQQLSSWRARVLAYAILHDPGLRSPTLETFHAKILLADADKAYIGSANMTRWSRDFSMECGVIIRGPCVKPIAKLVSAIISISKPLYVH